MSLVRSTARGRPAALVAVLLALVALLPALGAGSPVAADPAPEVAGPVAAYVAARDELAAAEATLATARARLAEATAVRTAAAEEQQRRAGVLDEQRERYSDLSAELYIRQGGSDQDQKDSMFLALAGRRMLLDAAKEANADAEDRLEDAEEALDEVAAEVAAAEAGRAESLTRADDTAAAADAAIAATGASDLPVVAYLAYRDAAAAANAADPACELPAAVLAGIGRIASGHGRNQGSSVDHAGRVEPVLRGLLGGRRADTDGGAIDGDSGGDRAVGPFQLSPAAWAASGTDGDGDGQADADDLHDAAATTAALLCAGDGALDTAVALERAVLAILGDTPQTNVALGTARRYARTTELDLGEVPPDPRASAANGEPQFDDGTPPLAPGDVLGMLDWAMTRVGTPYSQCLGPEARPQDPICPPGTSRFGNGFFDCSGFVSTAYRRIGVTVPATTYAMEADPRFMATRVADRIDLSVMQPGDVFLMDGHTGMYAGGGMIIHAIGAGLTHEPVPRWVSNGTFAVLRPVDLG